MIQEMEVAVSNIERIRILFIVPVCLYMWTQSAQSVQSALFGSIPNLLDLLHGSQVGGHLLNIKQYNGKNKGETYMDNWIKQCNKNDSIATYAFLLVFLPDNTFFPHSFTKRSHVLCWCLYCSCSCYNGWCGLFCFCPVMSIKPCFYVDSRKNCFCF